MVATDSPSFKLGMTARKHAESMSREEMPPCTVLEGVKWMDAVVKLRIARLLNWDLRVTPRVVWIGVARTEQVKFLVYEEDMVDLRA
jgi:hypothetical protein